MAKGKKSLGLSKVLATAKAIVLVPIRVITPILRVVFRPLRPITRPTIKYLRGVRAEFRKVTWPKRREAWRLTLAVMIFSVVFAAFVTIVDYGISTVFEKVIIKG